MEKAVNELADRFITGELDEAGLAELERLMTEDPSAGDSFVDNMSLHTDLFVAMRANRLTTNITEAFVRSADVVEESQDLTVLPEAAMPERTPKPWLLIGSLAAVIACSLLVVVWNRSTLKTLNEIASVTVGDRQSPNNIPQVIPAADAVATLYDSVNPVWLKQSSRLSPGTPLPAGERLRLETGLAELAFRSGVQILIEGPVELELLSDMAVRLNAGRLTAKVPEDAIGFSVKTDSASVMDLGTEFGVSVDCNNESEVIVFDGQVIVSPRGEPSLRQRLLAGDRIRTDVQGIVDTADESQEIETDSLCYVRTMDRQMIRDDGQGQTVANFRRDFQVAEPDHEVGQPGWKYLWNGLGPQGNPEHYQPLLWNGSFAYDTNGTGPFPATDPAYSLHLREVGGHPGRDADSSEVHDFGHGPVVAFTVPSDGRYAIVDSWLARFDSQQNDDVVTTNEFGLDLLVHVNGEQPVFQQTMVGVQKSCFDVELGDLHAGDTIYIAVGPNHSSRYDTFHWNFSIVRWDVPASVDLLSIAHNMILLSSFDSNLLDEG